MSEVSYQPEEYRAPNGAVDFPFVYVYDASGLTDAKSYQDIQIPVQGDSDFILRAIKGVNLCVDTPANGGKFSYKNASCSYANANPTSGIISTANWCVLPEKLYPANSGVFIDLYTTLRHFNACGGTPIYDSNIGFFGAKRFPQGSEYGQPQTSYKFRRKPQTYEFTLTIDWAHFDTSGAVAPYRRFIQQMDNYDFELLGFRVEQSGQVSPLARNDFQITLYDRNMHATCSGPVNQAFLNSARATPQTAPPYRTQWPSPILIYPAGSQICFDIVSLLCSTSVPQSYLISFVGVWRLPC